MSPQDRSLVIGGVAFLAALTLLFVSMTAVDRSDDDEIAGQYIDNLSPIDPAPAGRSPATAGVEPSGAVARGDDTASFEPPTGPTMVTPPANPLGDDTADPQAAPSALAVTEATSTTATTTAPVTSVPADEPPTPPSTAAPPTPPATGVATTPPTTAAPTTAAAPTPPTTEAATSPSSAGEQATTAPANEPTPAAASLDPVELELFRLTNELRADPSGPLAREKPMPDCVDDPFYAISIDDSSGHPSAVDPLTLSEPVSLQMARPWAFDMNRRDTLQHRPNGSQLEIYQQLDITIAATGENVAWMSGFPDSQAAQIHFEGWRESDTGHYCVLLSSTYTHLGVGHIKGASRSWAVQNYYRER